MAKKNPIYHRTIPASAVMPSKKKQPVRTWMRRKGVPDNVIYPILSQFGWPNSEIGHGAFAIVVRYPDKPDMVVKFTSDVNDASMLARLRLLRDQDDTRATVEVLAPIVYHVFEVPYKHKKTGKAKKVWAIVLEKVVPIMAFRAREHYDPTMVEVSKVISNLFLDDLSEVQRKVYRRTRGGKPLTPRMIGDMKEALEKFMEHLQAKGSRIAGGALKDMPKAFNESLAGSMLYEAGERVWDLISLDMPVIDLHPGNWGLRYDEDSYPHMLIIDFGLSSGGEYKAEEIEKTVLEVEPASWD